MTLVSTSELTLRLEGDDADLIELDRLTRQLRRELLPLVDDVRPCSAGDAPLGARAVDATQIGSLLVTLATAPEVLRSVVGLVRDWLGRSRARSVHLEVGGHVLEVTGVSTVDQHRLIETWIADLARS
jgi:hypothetical protein